MLRSPDAPANALLLHPESATKVSDLQVAEPAGTTLDERVRAIAAPLTGDRTAADLRRQLMTRHRVADDTYRSAEAAFGTKGILDLCAVMGVYHMMCSLMSVFKVPAP